MSPGIRPAAPALRRGRAYARDCIGYLVLPAALVPIGIPVSLLIEDEGTARTVGLVSSAIPPVLAMLWAARAESGEHAATWGKRREGLRVVRTTGAGAVGPTGSVGSVGSTGADGSDGDEMESAVVSFPRALVRNLVKIALPWQLGHIVAVGAVLGDFEVPAFSSRSAMTTMAAAVLLYPLILGLAGTVVLGSGRGLHDRAAGTRVVVGIPAGTAGRTRPVAP